jgi:Bacterial dnaA protein helix-turn-helix
MATVAFAPSLYRRLSLAKIDAVVSARLGPTRIPGNEQPACFNRQVAMYLAKHVGGWSTTVIGRFYNGRDHSTVCHGIQRVESLRESNPEVDALLAELKLRLDQGGDERDEAELPEALRKSASFPAQCG